ncbi:SPTBN5 (predicted) [Pycnogonum litorale]
MIAENNIVDKVSAEIGVPHVYIREVYGGVVCLVHEEWLKSLCVNRVILKEFIFHPDYNDDEVNCLIRHPQFKPQIPWLLIFVQVIKKNKHLTKSLGRTQETVINPKLSYSQMIHYITETNVRNLWKEANSKIADIRHVNSQHNNCKGDFNAVREAFRRVYQCPHIDVTTKESEILNDPSGDCHVNTLKAFATVESASHFYVIHPYLEHTLHSCVSLSPAILESSKLQSLFLIYQLLQVTKDFHDKGIYIGNLTLRDIFTDDCLWLRINALFWKSTGDRWNDDAGVNSNASSLRPNESLDQVGVPRNVTTSSLDSLVHRWVHGEISNFDYLLALNKLAGRQTNNANYHPVLPWIMNFTHPKGGWRDLTCSKYRLNKGDQQLDMTYDTSHQTSNFSAELDGAAYSSQLQHAQVPHHVSDILSDITYYVYKARRTPKSILCKHVRSKWVPAEYPSSMQRLQEWTPEECIPEFYSDPTIFVSVHDDLPDLDVPSWAASYEDFIRKHRAALESDHVSRRLHYWIDLTFGHKLSGSAAVSSKNVCLHLVDKHKNLTTSGVVQLFNYPHPRRLMSAINKVGTKLVPPSFRSVVKEPQPVNQNTTDELASAEENASSSESLKIRLPSVTLQKRSNSKKHRGASVTKINNRKVSGDYNPLAVLHQFESLYNFAIKNNLRDPKRFEIEMRRDEVTKHAHRKIRDIQVLACIVVEMYQASKFRAVNEDVTLDERYKRVRRLLSHSSELPRGIYEIVKVLLQSDCRCDELPSRYPAVSSVGLPPPSAHQLLQPLVTGFCFPPYFGDLYDLLSNLKEYSSVLRETRWAVGDSVRNQLVLSVIESKVKSTSNVLSSLLPKMSVDAMPIVVPFVKEMLEDRSMSVMATWELFNLVSEALGPRQSVMCFLPSLQKLFTAEHSTSKYLKIFHRSFLLQLIVRLGLKTFLAHFSTLLVEAVSGFKDFGCHECCTIGDECDSHSKKGSFLCSPQVQELDQLDDSVERNGTPTLDLDSTPEKVDEPEVFWMESPMFENVPDDDSDNSEVEKELLTSTSSDDIYEESPAGDDDRGSALFSESNEAAADPTDSPSDGNDRATCQLSKSVPVKLSDFEQGQASPDKLDSFSLNEESASDVAFDFSDGAGRMESCSSVKTKPSPSEYNISDVATESIIWLSHRLGPVLTAKYLCRNLLRMLPLCYLGEEQAAYVVLDEGSDELSICHAAVVGDNSSRKIIDCLSCIASLYGEQMILLQYLPYITDQVALCRRRITEMGEAVLLCSMCLLKGCLPFMSDATLMDHLQEPILNEVLYPITQLVSSTKLSFPNGGHIRQVISYKLVDILYMIGVRIGFEMTRRHLHAIIHRFFLSFDRIPEYKIYVKELKEPQNTVTKTSAGGEDEYWEIRKNSHDEYVIGSPVRVGSLQDWRVGASNSNRCLTPTVGDEKLGDHILLELRTAFTPALASSVYISFCKLAGGIFMEQTLTNDELIRGLCILHDEMMMSNNGNAGAGDRKIQSKLSTTDSTRNKDDSSSSSSKPSCMTVSGKFGENVAVVGNRIELGNDNSFISGANHKPDGRTPMPSASKCNVSKGVSHKMENVRRHLRGNWLAYWEHEIGRSDKDDRFSFKQIKLQSFVGHSGSIRSIQVLDNENSFMSASKDKTVKLWSIRSEGDGTAQSSCQLTYNNHKKSVYGVAFLDSLRLVGSTDGSVHLWDPFLGSCIKQMDSGKNTVVNILTALPPPSKMFVAATSDANLRFLDARTLKYVHEYKVSITPAGLIRSIGVSPSGNWIAVGHSTGIISVLDTRTGMISAIWKGHEGEILQLKVFDDNLFVTSSLDYTLSAWTRVESKARCYLKGPTEPVTCLNFYKNQVISGTTANRIGVHTSVDSKASYSSVRLRSDTFKGVLTTSAILPLNKLLLLGSDNGNISLLC